MFMRRAVFLDRDGVLNRTVLREGRAVSPRKLAEFELLPRVREAVEALKRAELLAIVVTNQPDIARGQLDRAELERMHERLREQVPVEAIYTCPHDDADGCACRKPKPGLLLRAAQEWNAGLAESFLVGDSWKDVLAGKTAGCTSILIAPRSAPAVSTANFQAPTLEEAAALILAAVEKTEAPSAAVRTEGSWRKRSLS